MKGSYKLSAKAEEDLYQLWLYGLERFGLAAADAYYDQFFAHFELLARNPMQYSAVNHIREGYRRSVCGVDSVYYSVNGNTVEIVSILRQQNVDVWLNSPE